MSDQEFIDRLVGRLREGPAKPREQAPQSNGHPHTPPASLGYLTDREVLDKLFAERGKGARWKDLYDGIYEPYHPSASEAVASLLWKLAFYTGCDPVQMDRLIRASGLSNPKFDERRGGTTWLAREIGKAIEVTDEVFKPSRGRGVDRHRHRHPIYKNDDDDSRAGTEPGAFASICFAEMDEPKKPEEVWEGIITRGWPALWFGGTGVTKSVLAVAAAEAIADENTHVFLGRDVITAPVMYADWELNENVQGRRAYQIARGRGRLAPPRGLRYMSTYGAARRDRRGFISNVLKECEIHKAEVCFIDSVGLAVSGNPGDFEVVVEFFEEVVADFTARGITPVLIDHQRRLVPGERNQSLGAYGSVWKENLARTQMQIELVRRDREAHTVTTRLRAKKSNFGELAEPIEVKTMFSEDRIALELTETDDADRAGEETLPARDRVKAAIRALGKAGPNAIHEQCGGTLAKGTIKNEIGKLRKAGEVEDTGEAEPGGGRIVIVTGTYRDDDDDDDSKTRDIFTVEEAGETEKDLPQLLTSPPSWVRNQARAYVRNGRDERQLPPLAYAIVTGYLGDEGRFEEALVFVQEHVEELANSI